MDSFLIYAGIGVVCFVAGIFSGITVLRKTWLEPGFKMGFIQDGEDAYTITKKRRNR